MIKDDDNDGDGDELDALVFEMMDNVGEEAYVNALFGGFREGEWPCSLHTISVNKTDMRAKLDASFLHTASTCALEYSTLEWHTAIRP
jgi:hypothetical protein